MSIRIIGIDCATESRKVGVAFGDFADGAVTIESVRVGSRDWDWDAIVKSVAEEIRAAPRALLALDAPLGWPAPMGDSLAEHTAGSTLEPTADRMFLRETDRLITKVAKKPLEVGANLIARTAHSALQRLNEIRKESGRSLPLAWDSAPIAEAQVIEVYPAATLLAHGLSDTGYKGTEAKHLFRPRGLSVVGYNAASNGSPPTRAGQHQPGYLSRGSKEKSNDQRLDGMVLGLRPRRPRG